MSLETAKIALQELDLGSPESDLARATDRTGAAIDEYSSVRGHDPETLRKLRELFKRLNDMLREMISLRSLAREIDAQITHEITRGRTAGTSHLQLSAPVPGSGGQVRTRPTFRGR